MSDTNVKQIKEVTGGMVSVPVEVLQSLIWNSELAVVGMGVVEGVVNKQCAELSRYLDAARPVDYVDPNEGFTLEPFSNVVQADFGNRGNS